MNHLSFSLESRKTSYKQRYLCQYREHTERLGQTLFEEGGITPAVQQQLETEVFTKLPPVPQSVVIPDVPQFILLRDPSVRTFMRKDSVVDWDPQTYHLIELKKEYTAIDGCSGIMIVPFSIWHNAGHYFWIPDYRTVDQKALIDWAKDCGLPESLIPHLVEEAEHLKCK